MPSFNMMIGLPGSGKSTYAEKLAKEIDAVVFSSDLLRQELLGDVHDQESNEFIFEEMHRRIIQHLDTGGNVIYDATNTNRKRRKHLINHVIKCEKKSAYYINEHYDTVTKRNTNRERRVSQQVIDKMYQSLQIPLVNEGWDELIVVSSEKNTLDSRLPLENMITAELEHDVLFSHLQSHIPDFQSIYNVPHDSSYHSFSISRHTYHVWERILNNDHEADKLQLLWAALFHDLGKGFCKSFVNFKGESTRYASFIGHEYVSSQLAVYWLTKLGYDKSFIQLTSDLIQMHMVPMNASDKKMKEVKQLIGEHAFNQLMILHEADTGAK
ncbi:HD domain-containing protein [Bacillus sp. FJAT-42376]|uniref:ATP-binding protein n=1 Tax=Bacillus sp. FJAT-42376 TaxID=2014076 RepID=UPI000F4D4ADF|nr:ATP-binding protein [Bacillus sp. FJAT-42376]AZB44642.1 HD domain-containing protein [Bacillus sp. FJAT-42376]